MRVGARQAELRPRSRAAEALRGVGVDLAEIGAPLLAEARRREGDRGEEGVDDTRLLRFLLLDTRANLVGQRRDAWEAAGQIEAAALGARVGEAKSGAAVRRRNEGGGSDA